MSIEGLNKERCDRRRSIAATRFGVDAVPLRFRGHSVAEANEGWTVLNSIGEVPENPKDAIALINANLPAGSDALSAEDVFIHVYEAANDNYVADRSCFLAESTLRNIAADAEHGAAFMNSHRTGDMSAPSELPYGQSFAGQYQEGIDGEGRLSKRALIAVYMARDIQPNGQAGPSTTDLDRMFSTGALKDVSVGLRKGERLCDICGNPFGYGDGAYDKKGRKLCRHAMGTTRNMTPEQVKGQQDRDPRNEKGVASYTMHNARLGELSAVYDGAVPGAGIRQVLSLAKSGEMSKDDVREMLSEAFNYYRDQFDFDLADIVSIEGAEPSFRVPVPSNKIQGSNTMSNKALLLASTVAASIAPYLGLSAGGEQDEENDDLHSAPAAPPGQAPALPVVRTDGDSSLSQKDRLELERFRANEATNLESEALRREQGKQEDRKRFEAEIGPKVTPSIRPHFLLLFGALQKADETNPVACNRLCYEADGVTQKFGEDGKPVTESMSHTQLFREVVAGLEPNFTLGQVPTPDASPEIAEVYARSTPQVQPPSELETLVAASKAQAQEYVNAGKKPGADKS